MQLDLLAALNKALAGRYTVSRELGRGGMAVVYAARDLTAERDVAIKLLYPDLARAVGGERFLREIRILQQLSHPNILPLNDSGTIELLPGLDVPWYAMPLARDETLRARLTRDGPLPLATALGFARDLCAALTHAHAQGIIHRDIKPENVLLVDGRAVLADFGVARAVTIASGNTLSTTGIVVGTPAYMSPEQSVGVQQLDGRSDLYSVAVVLYEMLAGHPPFTGSTPQAVSARHQFETPPPIGVVRPGLPDGVTVVLERALAKVAADRFQQASELETALSTLPRRNVSASWTRWRRAPFRLGAVALLVLLLGSVGWSTINTDLPSTALAVLPFASSVTNDSSLCGSECSTLVDDALNRLNGVALVSQLRIRNSLSLHGRPHSRRGAEQIARALGAGRFIWGETSNVGDSLRIRMTLFQIRRIGSREVNAQTFTAGIPPTGNGSDSASAALVAAAFRLRARMLLESSRSAALQIDAPPLAFDLRAVRLKLQGDSSFAGWDIPSAIQSYVEAIKLEPHYPQAHLMLALIESWQGKAPAVWGPHAAQAASDRTLLTPHQALLAEAYASMYRKEHQEACRLMSNAIAADSADFAAWLGLGDCLRTDDAVLPSTTNSSGWEFRGGYAKYMRAYYQAFLLAPSLHKVMAGSAADGFLDRVFLFPWQVRLGFQPEPRRGIIAVATQVGDSIDQVPDLFWFRNRDTAGRDEAGILTAASMIPLKLTSQWIKEFPRSSAAWNLLALVLEERARLDQSNERLLPAIEAFRRAYHLTTDPGEQLDIGAALVRMQLKLGQRGSAERLADSLLAHGDTTSIEQTRILAGLAAFRLDTMRAVRLARATPNEDSFASFLNNRIYLSDLLKASSVALSLFALFEGPKDSITTLAESIVGATGFTSPTDEQQEERRILAQRAMIQTELRIQVNFGNPLDRVREALSIGDTVSARKRMVEARDGIAGWRTRLPRSPELSLAEARLSLRLGDTTAAKDGLSAIVERARALSSSALRDAPQAAAIGLTMRLYDSLTSH